MVDHEHSSAVVFHTAHFILEGRVALVPGARLTDFIKESRDFIAMVDVRMRSSDGGEVIKQLPFLDVRRDSIEIAYPAG